MSMDRHGKDNMKCQLVERAVKIIWGQTSRCSSKCKRSKLGERGRKHTKSGQTYLGKKWEEKKERRNKAKKASAWRTSLGCCRQAEVLEKRKAVILPIAVNSCNVWMVPRAQVWVWFTGVKVSWPQFEPRLSALEKPLQDGHSAPPRVHNSISLCFFTWFYSLPAKYHCKIR